MTYDPFDKRIDELTASDLESLIENQVVEGYWVEYKADFVANRKIAQSIASFANSYGGWYFVGIASDKKKNVPTSLSGFSWERTPDPIAKVRDLAKSNIDPIPFFEIKVIEISERGSVLVVYVPENQETPFVTSDGRIYRRVADSSEPVSENNRYAIDRLVDDGKQAASAFEEFCTDERLFGQEESSNGWVSIFLVPYPPVASGLTSIKEGSIKDALESAINLSHTTL